ncbi:hypothetical protein ABIA30_004279 [Mycobacterium sp. MAA66]|uniref:hypothetical protein n=1 Tax=Mycobacterium sp. MAA66 TaxID=3156297 RepID=UPI00351906F8
MTRGIAGLSADANRRLATAVHESAHACLAVVQDLRVDRAELLSTPARIGQQPHAAGYVKFEPYGSLGEHRAPVALAAGAAAEMTFDAGRAPSLKEVLVALSTHHTHDNGEIERMSFAHGQNPMGAVLDALPQVSRLWGPICRLSLQLDKQRRIEHADVLAALSIPSATDAHRYTRAIREGAEPGSLYAAGRYY